MKAHLIDTHLLVPRSRSSAKVKVKYKGYISQKNGRFGGIRVSQTNLVSFVDEPDFIRCAGCPELIPFVDALSLYHTILTFNNPNTEGLGKHWENKKMLVTSIFSFSNSVFYSIKERKSNFSNV